jgi:hypothetical protein
MMKRKLFISGVLGLGVLCMAYSTDHGIAINPTPGGKKLNKRLFFRNNSNSLEKLKMTPQIPRKKI